MSRRRRRWWWRRGDRPPQADLGDTAWVRRPHDWLRQAQADLEAAEGSRAQGRFEWACFAAHQAAEKAAKALHESVGTEAWGHSVTGLLRGLEGVPEEMADVAKSLDKHYISSRYPNAHQEGAPADLYTRAEADRAIDDATEILTHAQRRLPSA